MQEYHKKSKKKYLLQCHLIFVTKYRKNILGIFREELLKVFEHISKRSNFVIKEMEIDSNHIHFLIDYEPKISITSIVRKLKQESTKNIWELQKSFLSLHYWKHKTLWSDGYFVCSIGNANEEVIKNYIRNQG